MAMSGKTANRRGKVRRITLPVSKKEKQEGGPGRRGLVFCSDCRAVYFKKSWHHNLRHLKIGKNELALGFKICPACKMIKNRQFEGRVVVKNVPPKIASELAALVKAFTRRAYLSDPLDRLIGMKNSPEGLEVLLTENQTAVRLAKKIKQVFHKSDVKISYPRAPGDVVTAFVAFK